MLRYRKDFYHFCSQLFYVALFWFRLTAQLADPLRKVLSEQDKKYVLMSML